MGKKLFIILLLISFTIFGCTSKNKKSKIDTFLESKCNTYKIFENFSFGGGEGQSTGKVYYVKCNNKDAIYTNERPGLHSITSTENIEYIDIYQKEHEIYTFKNQKLYMLVDDNIENHLYNLEKIYKQGNINEITVFSITDNLNGEHVKSMLISSMYEKNGCRLDYNAKLYINPYIQDLNNFNETLRANIKEYNAEIKCW